jgi:histidinol dehydrogenase
MQRHPGHAHREAHPVKALRPRFTGALSELGHADRKTLLERARTGVDETIELRVRQLIARVRAGGDRALHELTRELDHVDCEALEVPRGALDAARDALDPTVRRALERAARNIETVHRAFLPAPIEVVTEPGVVVGRRPDPLAAVGVYAPGGRAAYPSSVLMGVVPARVAGVRDVVVLSPPGPSGRPSDVVLAAAAIAGASRVFALGGAQAIAAVAYGTETVPKVDRIVGPGNAYVAEAKRQVAGDVGIDAPAGPSEILILADRDASPSTIVRELLAQAEHDPDASVVAVVESEPLADRVLSELSLATPARRDVIESALTSRSAVLWVDRLDDGIALANDYAAEHLLVAARDPDAWLARIRHAGTVFLGEAASVAFGDYLTGANHVLPTAGLARSFSGLSSLDFVRWTTWQRVSPEAARAMAADTATLAEAEGLPAHAAAARGAGAAPGGAR